MSGEAIVTMVLGMLAVWGGLVTSLVLTLHRARRRDGHVAERHSNG